MTGCKRGDVVLIRFIFSGETGERQRPAVIVSSDAYHQSRQEAIIAAITTRTDRMLVGNHLISDWQEAGLLFPSVATGIVRTIKRGMIAKKLGIMPLPDMKRIEGNLRDALGVK